jgi:hypothetical protein
MCDVHTSRIGAIVMSTFLAAAAVARGQDWPQFRGPGGAGVAPADARVPLTWDAKANVAWKCPLPGPGASPSLVTIGRRQWGRPFPRRQTDVFRAFLATHPCRSRSRCSR